MHMNDNKVKKALKEKAAKDEVWAAEREMHKSPLLNASGLYGKYFNKRYVWDGTDTEAQYNSNLRIIEKYNLDWEFKGTHNKQNFYVFNNLGFRENFDFDDDFDFSDYVVFLGCSHVAGTGLPKKYTIPSMFTKKSGIKSINLSIAGSSNEKIFLNALWALSLKHPPKDIIVCWTHLARFSHIQKDGSSDFKYITDCTLSHNTLQDPLYKSNYRPNYVINPEQQRARYLAYRDLFEKLYTSKYGKEPKSYSFFENNDPYFYFENEQPRHIKRIKSKTEGMYGIELLQYMLNSGARARDFETINPKAEVHWDTLSGGHYGRLMSETIASIILENHKFS